MEDLSLLAPLNKVTSRGKAVSRCLAQKEQILTPVQDGTFFDNHPSDTWTCWATACHFHEPVICRFCGFRDDRKPSLTNATFP